MTSPSPSSSSPPPPPPRLLLRRHRRPLPGVVRPQLDGEPVRGHRPAVEDVPDIVLRIRIRVDRADGHRRRGAVAAGVAFADAHQRDVAPVQEHLDRAVVVEAIAIAAATVPPRREDVAKVDAMPARAAGGALEFEPHGAPVARRGGPAAAVALRRSRGRRPLASRTELAGVLPGRRGGAVLIAAVRRRRRRRLRCAVAEERGERRMILAGGGAMLRI